MKTGLNQIQKNLKKEFSDSCNFEEALNLFNIKGGFKMNRGMENGSGCYDPVASYATGRVDKQMKKQIRNKENVVAKCKATKERSEKNGKSN